MSGDRPTSSFGDPSAQPPTPKQTPTSAVYPSPVLTTPRQNQGAFSEPDQGSWTPRFAEEYSVFNSTPGNLRASEGRFEDFATLTGHRRFVSSESVPSGLTPTLAQGQFSPNLGIQLPPASPAIPLPPSPFPLNTPKSKTSHFGALPSPSPSVQTQSLQGSSQESTQTQIATPPPTSHKKGRKRAPTLNMNQDGQEFGQADFVATSQSQDLNNLIVSPGDLFSYPMSAPVTAPDNFWDPNSIPLPMDMDFGSGAFFQPDTPSGHHRQTGSFDWNNEVQLFQDPQQPAPAPTQQTKSSAPAAKKARTLAPKPPAASHSMVHPNISMTDAPVMGDAIGIMGSGAGVDPGILLSRPQTAVADASFNAMNDAGSAEAALVNKGQPSTGVRRFNSVKETRNGKMPDRAFASSPVKPSVRPGLTRSQSENRGKKSIGRGAVANQLSISRPEPASNGSGMDPGRGSVRGSGGVSPLKRQHRQSLASIAETIPQSSSMASVKFVIGADGRARAEATQPPPSFDQGARRTGSHSSGEADEYDSSESDDEPIIIPSRNTSFNTSFALPDPQRPVGSIFHPSRRSISDHSTSTLTASDIANANGQDVESEAETVMNDGNDDGADAANELLRVKENRQLAPTSFSSSKTQRYFGISPTKTDSGNTTDDLGVRCVCNRSDMNGFLVQCESCEMWQHGNCVNQRSQPSVYICAFCANTPNMRGGRLRDTNRGLDMGVGSSPLASKSFRSLR